MNLPLRVEVTAADIALGCRSNRENCPIARAIQRAVPGVYVSVSQAEITIGGHEFDTPPAADGFIVDFDGGEPVGPFAFELAGGDATSFSPCPAEVEFAPERDGLVEAFEPTGGSHDDL